MPNLKYNEKYGARQGQIVLFYENMRKNRHFWINRFTGIHIVKIIFNFYRKTIYGAYNF